MTNFMLVVKIAVTFSMKSENVSYPVVRRSVIIERSNRFNRLHGGGNNLVNL